ncbi:MAG: hypothetical protein ABSE72_04420 [Bacteroidales bacterium]|jgi:hypothetical protein
MKNEIDPGLLNSKEKFCAPISLRFNEIQMKKIKTICRQCKINYPELFRFLLEDFLKHNKIKANGKRQHTPRVSQ